jgi:hypothetical protein
MDIFLLFITIVSLGIAVIMSVVAWRLTREERARSAARIAALAAAADSRVADTPPIEHTEVAVRPTPWRAPQTPRPTAAPATSRRQAEPLADFREERALLTSSSGDEIRESFLGSTVAAPPSGGRQRGLAIAAAILFVAVVTGGYFSLYGEKQGGAVTAAVPGHAGAPLELISLRHERQNGALAITGLVKNPSAGTPVEKLAAVVFLFDGQGSFLTSSRAGVDFTQLAPGDESPFVIRIDSAPKNVARYRVSFRTDAGVVPHVDRRGQEPIARGLP